METDYGVKAAVVAFFASLTAIFGWFGWLVIIFVVCMLIDYLTGSIAASKRQEWSSRAARDGIWHKAGSFVAVIVAGLADLVVGLVINNIPAITLPIEYTVLICPIVITWYIITELGSIIENAGAMGAPIPGFLRKAIKSLGKAVDSTGDRLIDGGTKQV